MSDQPRWGELWWSELPGTGRRPVLVLSRDAAIPRLGRAMVAPCTTTIRHLPSEVLLEPGDDPVPRPTVVNLDTIETISVGVLTSRLGVVSHDRMGQICAALAVATDCG